MSYSRLTFANKENKHPGESSQVQKDYDDQDLHMKVFLTAASSSAVRQNWAERSSTPDNRCQWHKDHIAIN